MVAKWNLHNEDMSLPWHRIHWYMGKQQRGYVANTNARPQQPNLGDHIRDT